MLPLTCEGLANYYKFSEIRYFIDENKFNEM